VSVGANSTVAIAMVCPGARLELKHEGERRLSATVDEVDVRVMKTELGHEPRTRSATSLDSEYPVFDRR
jgi:hypothetical protein